MRRFSWNPLDAVTVNGRSIEEQVKTITLNGTMEVVSDINLGKKSSLSLKRTYFPSTELPSLIEIYEFTNTGKNNLFSNRYPILHIRSICSRKTNLFQSLKKKNEYNNMDVETHMEGI